MKNTFAIAISASLVVGCTSTPAYYPRGAKGYAEDQCRALKGKPEYDSCYSIAFNGKKEDDAKHAAAVIVTAAAVVGAIAYCKNHNCGGGTSRPSANYVQPYAWDRFSASNAYGNMWACRSTSTGQFVDDFMCSSLAKIDNTWPGDGEWRPRYISQSPHTSTNSLYLPQTPR